MRKEELARDMDPDKLKVNQNITGFETMPAANYITGIES
jgi:hypothetical protein